jgi:hypothetical protein
MMLQCYVGLLWRSKYSAPMNQHCCWCWNSAVHVIEYADQIPICEGVVSDIYVNIGVCVCICVHMWLLRDKDEETKKTESTWGRPNPKSCVVGCELCVEIPREHSLHQ